MISGLKKIIFHMTILIIPLFTLSCFFPYTLGNKIILAVMMIAYIDLNYLFLRYRKRIRLVFFNLILVAYVCYFICIGKYSVLSNMYFYSCVLFFTFSEFFLLPNLLNEYLCFFINHKKEFVYSIISFFLLIIISLLNKTGYRYNSVDKEYLLYGPFELQHMLAYMLLAIYCGCSIYDKENCSFFFLVIKVLVLVSTILTGVRSAALALGLLIIYDYLSMKNIKQKWCLFVLVIAVLFIVATQTDILTDNTLINKTLTAVNRGSITNGRGLYRKVQMEAFLYKSNFVQKILGVSIQGVIEYMVQAIGVGIQAHNDYVNALVGYGIVGFILFISMQFRFCLISRSSLGSISLFLFLFLLSFFNGFTFYIMLTSALPIILCFFKVKKLGTKRLVLYS